jgi:glucokinase
MTLEEDVAVAVDVGGTGIKCALVDTAGVVRFTLRRDTGRDRGPDAVVNTIVTIAAELAERARTNGLTPIAAGVVVPGVVDEAAGVAQWSANLGLRDVPIRDLVGAQVGLPTALGHDVRAGALAEARLGAGRTTRRMLFVAIGTGIAGGYVVDGRIDPGAHGASGEIGHIVVRTGSDAAPCGCGARGCLEAHASASAIARAYAEAADDNAADNTDNNVDNNSTDGAPSAARVAELVARGEPRAIGVWEAAVAALADGLLTGIALYDPRVIVLGGGLAEAGQILLGPLRQALEQRRTFHRLPELALAELGDEAGCQGAALLALDLVGSAP